MVVVNKDKEVLYMSKQLFRSDRNRVIAGVCGGLGEYFGFDPILLRLLFVISALFGGISILPYLLAIIIIPRRRYY